MIETALCFAIGSLIGLSGTWVIRKQQAYDRALSVLVLYLPLNGLSIIICVLCAWLSLGTLSEGSFFSGMVGWMGCLLGMLTNMCSKPPLKQKPDKKKNEF